MTSNAFKITSKLAAYAMAVFMVFAVAFAAPPAGYAAEGEGATGAQTFDFTMQTYVRYDTLFVLVQNESGAPLVGARVEAEGFEQAWTTDETGKVAIEGVEAGGSYALRVQGDGYQSAAASYVFEGQVKQETLTVVLKAIPDPPIPPNPPIPPGPTPDPGPQDEPDVWKKLPTLGDVLSVALPVLAVVAALAAAILLFMALKRRKKNNAKDEG